MMRDEAIAVWAGSEHGPNPETDAITPWTFSGPGTHATTADGQGIRITHAGPGAASIYGRRLWPADTSTGPARPADAVEAQVRLRGYSSTPAWSGGSGTLGLLISDGAHYVALSVGDELAWVSPASGEVIAEIEAPFPWLATSTIVVRKDGTARWMVWANGRLLSELPYLRAPVDPSPLARVEAGVLDGAGAGVVELYHLEAALNLSVAPLWHVERYLGGLPAAVVRTLPLWSTMWAMVGLFELAARMMTSLWTDLTAVRRDILEVRYAGDRLPAAEDARWVYFTPAQLSVVRERVRFTGLGAAQVRVETINAAPHSSIPMDVDTEFTLNTTWLVRSYTPDAQGRVGPFLWLHNGEIFAIAQLFEDGTGGHAWQLTDNFIIGPYTALGVAWPVNPYAEHEVEIQILGRDWVLLIVDGVVVDMQAYADFPVVVTANYTARLGVTGSLGLPVCVADTRHAAHLIRSSDQAFRPLLVTSALERNLHVGGAERPDLIETWSQRFNANVALRGGSNAIVQELNRITGSVLTQIVSNSAPASWYLEESYPDVTPIWLEVDGQIVDVYVEFTNQLPPNFDAAALAQVARRYLVPLSTEDLEYFICVACRLTVLAPAPASGTITLTVDDTHEFALLDPVTLRDPTNATVADTVIVSVTAPSTIEIEAVVGTFPVGSVLRKVLATT